MCLARGQACAHTPHHVGSLYMRFLWLLQEFSINSVTQNNTDFVPHSPGGQKANRSHWARIMVLAELAPSGGPRDKPFPALSSL